MKIQNLVNLVKYYGEHNDSAFRSEVFGIAKDFKDNGQAELGAYLIELVSKCDCFYPQSDEYFLYLEKKSIENSSLFLPDSIKKDVFGIINCIRKHNEISKFLFYGEPGTGKTESVNHIARLTNRELFSVSMEKLIDSKLGQTSKNIVSLFEEIRELNSNKVIIFFDELDALAMNRNVNNDIREMGRVTSTFLKELDKLDNKYTLIAATNLIKSFDKALLRRFEAKICFDKYSKDDLVQIGLELFNMEIRKIAVSDINTRFVKKIFSSCEHLPYPGDLKQIIKQAIAFSSLKDENDYLKRLYYGLNNEKEPDLISLFSKGFTTREIEILTNVPRSSAARKIKELKGE